MITKQKGDIAEQAAILAALKRGWGVLKPIGDRLPYDLVFDIACRLIRIQVKAAWLDPVKGNYVVDNRRTKTNRRQMVREYYRANDFDLCLAYLADLDISTTSRSLPSSHTAARSTWPAPVVLSKVRTWHSPWQDIGKTMRL